MRRREKLVATVALGVAFVTLGHIASAQGAIYFNSQSFVVPDGAQTAGTALCVDNADEVIGTGLISNSSSTDLLYVNSLLPSPGTPDGATAYADNYAGGVSTNNPVAVVVCDSATQPPDYRLVEKTGEVPDETERQVTAKCRSGESVVGGGASNSGGFSDEATVTSSGPVDLGDPDKIPDDGWLGEINNDEDVDAVTLGQTTYAVCDSKHGGVRYRSTTKNVADGATQGKTAQCKGDERVIGGGVVSHSKYAHGMYVVDTYNTPTDDGWLARVANWPTPDGKGRAITVTAICLG